MHPIYNHLSENQKILVEKHFEEMLCNKYTVLAPNFVENLKYKHYQIKVIGAWTYNTEFSFVFDNCVYTAIFTYTQDEFSGRIELTDWNIINQEIENECDSHIAKERKNDF